MVLLSRESFLFVFLMSIAFRNILPQSHKIFTLIGGGGSMGKKLMTGVGGGELMQLFNDSSKNPTSPPYLEKNGRSLIRT